MARLDEIREMSRQLFEAAAARGGEVTETTPPVTTQAVIDFAQQLGSAPLRVPVINDPFGLYGWCVDGVRERARASGGSIRFGWTIWEWAPILLTAEFHAVWVSPTGKLQDITPKPLRETEIVFVPDDSYPDDFNFDNRPGNRRFRLYQPRPEAEIFAEIEARIAEMKPSQIAYEKRRAEKAGLTLQQALRRKYPIDPWPDYIDTLIALCEEMEANELPGSTGPIVANNAKYIQQARRRGEMLATLRQKLVRR